MPASHLRGANLQEIAIIDEVETPVVRHLQPHENYVPQHHVIGFAEQVRRLSLFPLWAALFALGSAAPPPELEEPFE